MAASSDIEKLMHDLEFENQQYVREIEKEKLVISAMEKQVADLKAECLRENKMTPQLDEDTKRFHKQFTTNRHNIDSSKKTLSMFTEHEDALEKKIALLQQQGKDESLKQQSIKEHYENIWQDYKKTYESFQLAQQLRRLQLQEQEAQQKNESVLLEEQEIQGKIHAFQTQDKTVFKPMTSLTSFVLHIVKLKTHTMDYMQQINREADECRVLQHNITKRLEVIKRQREEERKKKEEEERQQEENEKMQREEDKAKQKNEENSICCSSSPAVPAPATETPVSSSYRQTPTTQYPAHHYIQMPTRSYSSTAVQILTRPAQSPPQIVSQQPQVLSVRPQKPRGHMVTRPIPQISVRPPASPRPLLPSGEGMQHTWSPRSTLLNIPQPSTAILTRPTSTESAAHQSYFQLPAAKNKNASPPKILMLSSMGSQISTISQQMGRTSLPTSTVPLQSYTSVPSLQYSLPQCTESRLTDKSMWSQCYQRVAQPQAMDSGTPRTSSRESGASDLGGRTPTRPSDPHTPRTPKSPRTPKTPNQDDGDLSPSSQRSSVDSPFNFQKARARFTTPSPGPIFEARSMCMNTAEDNIQARGDAEDFTPDSFGLGASFFQSFSGGGDVATPQSKESSQLFSFGGQKDDPNSFNLDPSGGKDAAGQTFNFGGDNTAAEDSVGSFGFNFGSSSSGTIEKGGSGAGSLFGLFGGSADGDKSGENSGDQGFSLSFGITSDTNGGSSGGSSAFSLF